MTLIRLSTALLLLTVLAALALTAERGHPGPAVQASVGGIVSVDSTDDSNARDGKITLREAMLLVTGGLAVGALDADECDNVLGAAFGAICVAANPPSAANADKISFNVFVFSPENPETILIASPLPTLSTGNDLIEGSFAEVVVDRQTTGGGDNDDCFLITSNGNTIRGLEIKRCRIGIRIMDAAQNNMIGGDGEGQRNVLYDTGIGAITLSGPGTLGNSIIGNYIGTDASGNVAMGHQGGIRVNSGAQSNTIVGNVIAGGANVAITIRDAGTEDNVVQANYLGTNASGDAALPNIIGIEVSTGASNNIIGGSSEGEGNVISGNTFAGLNISSGAEGNSVIGNFIGTDASGENPIPNLTGVQFFNNGANNNTIGGVAEGESNLIAYNDEEGVLMNGVDSTGNTIRGNSIHSNGGKGIALVNGANTELAPPAITGFGSVTGTACPNCTIDVYSDSEDEGEVYEGTTESDGNGDWTLDAVPQGPFVTATATDADGNTSEFSAPADLLATPAPTPTLAPGETPGPTPVPTPTPTPVPVDELAQGDNDCDGDTDSVDALAGLRHLVALPVNQEPGCPALGGAVPAAAPAGDPPDLFGDVDCDNDVDSVDALKILRNLVALAVSQTEPCADIGQPF